MECSRRPRTIRAGSPLDLKLRYHEFMKIQPPCARTITFRGRLVGAICAIVVTSACGVRGNARNPFDGSAEREQAERLRIEVQNLNFNDVTVYAISAGQRTRLGSVTGKTDGSYTIAWNFANPIQFTVDVVGGRGCTTQPLSVEPGARIWVQIPADIGMRACHSGRG